MKKQLPIYFLFILFLFALSLNVNAQSWEKTFEQVGTLAKGFDVVEATDGGYVMCGEVDLPTGAIRHHTWVVKTDVDGNELWSRIYHYGGIGSDEARGLVETTDDGFMIVGRNLQGYFQILKISSAGDSLWMKDYPGTGFSIGEAVIPKADGSGFLIAGGIVPDPNIDVSTFWLVSLDNEGELLWEKSYEDMEGTGSKAMDIEPTSNGDFILVGTTQGTVAALVRIDSNGEQIWAKTYALSTGEKGLSVEEMTNGNLLLGGYTTGFAGTSPLLLHLDANGEAMINQPLISTINFGAVTDIEKTTNDGYILTGSGYSFWNVVDTEAGYIMKLNGNLELEWDSILKDNTAQGTAILQTSDGGFIMSGYEGGNMLLKKIAGMTNTNEELSVGEEWEVKVYPNPTVEQLIFELPEEMLTRDELYLKIYSSDGRLFKTKKITKKIEILILESAGIYSYVIEGDGGVLKTGMVTVL